jgi:hypothetical protein
MKEAMAYFLLANGIRDVRGDTREHRSMMIHVSRFTNVQDQINVLVYRWLEDMRSDLLNYACLTEKESDAIMNVAYLKSVWLKHRLAEKAGTEAAPMPWHTFLSEYLFQAAAPVVVRSVNQRNSAKGLDYYSHKDNGLRVIAIGGNSLSRGLTLEGLCVSYFYRRSLMYDTLLQMGRWFGYRPGYEDLFKIWISADAVDWYGYITAASEELKHEIVRMNEADLTPMEFGLKVRQDPASLIITARNKMRSATPVSRPITVSGRLLETPRLRSDETTIASNEVVFKSFIQRLAQIGQRAEDKGVKYFWKNVPKDEVEQLLRDFRTHPWQLNFQGSALADFIRDSSAVENWDVFIAEGSESIYDGLTSGDEILQMKPEKRAVKATSDQISISGTKARVGAGGATKIGLTDDERKICEDNFRKIAKNENKTHIPDAAYLRIERSPLLILHVVSVDKTGTNNNGVLRSQIDSGVQVPDYLFALGIGIPFNGEELIANYMVNMVEFKNYYEEDEDE